MIDTLKKYKAFGEFVEWMIANRHWSKEEDKFPIYLSDRELLSLLVEFCDSEGYWITVDADLVCDDSEEPKFNYWITALNKYDAEDAYEDSYATRTEATKAAVVKVFELMESEG